MSLEHRQLVAGPGRRDVDQRPATELDVETLDRMAPGSNKHRYEVVEHTDYHRLLGRLLTLGPADAHDEDRDVLDAAAERVFASLTADPETPGAREARRLVSGVASRQTGRELAWARMTGFPKGVPDSVADVLAAQAAAPGPRCHSDDHPDHR